jgi:NAD(P)H-hydrate repair Nnr-like enzyme with NAD(P)H-hydrate dehydratase domain
MTGATVHGQAAEILTERLGGMIGITASELIPEIRQLINR